MPQTANDREMTNKIVVFIHRENTQWVSQSFLNSFANIEKGLRQLENARHSRQHSTSSADENIKT